MTKPTKDPRAGGPRRPDPVQERTTNHRVRMTGNGSASTRSRVNELTRMRARRRRRRGPSVGPIISIALCALLIVALCLGVGWYRQQKELHRFDAYPIRYAAEVNAAAAEFDLEPAYLYAVILAESSFRPDAVSSVGALGLMQVMPETGEWIAGKLDLSDSFTADMLTDPALNVRFGSWYLRYLLNRYS